MTWPPSRGGWHNENYIRWSPDGSRILFDVSEDIYKGPVDLHSAAADGSSLENIAGVSLSVPIWAGPSTMMYLDVSPDGSHIAFSTCARNTDSNGYRWGYNYDIALANIDGTDAKNLTDNKGLENFPVWSPDGTRVAYLSSSEEFALIDDILSDRIRGRLSIHMVATGESKDIDLPTGDVAAFHPPAWSPDGQSLAFVAYEGHGRLSRAVVYTVGIDGSNLTKITYAASGPAWSPDGQRIAVAVPGGSYKASLYTFAPDGSDPTFVSQDLPEPWDEPVEPWLGNLSWSPDGSAILLEGFAHIVSVDGTTLFDGYEFMWAHLTKRLEGLREASGQEPPEEIPVELRRIMAESQDVREKYLENVHLSATWSPNGSQIAMRIEGYEDLGQPALQVFVMDREGGNPKVLVEGIYERSQQEFTLRLVR